jgi:lipopolysaccharide/colanic/teichoic acid biosynthesis glycosyltransferase
MDIVNRKDPIILILGDILAFSISLWTTLALRYFHIPDRELLISHFVPFSVVFIFSIFIFYIAGLYGRHTLTLKNSLPNLLFKTQIVNSLFAVVFFYFIPFLSIAPKTNLFIYITISIATIFIWRLFIFSSFNPKIKQNAVIIGSGREIDDLIEEINKNNLYSFTFVEVLNIEKIRTEELIPNLEKCIKEKQISIVIADIYNKNISAVLPKLYDLIFSKIQFIDCYKLYEVIFEKTPLYLLNHGWFAKHISLQNRFNYDSLKRLADVVFSLIIGVISLIFYPFIYLAIKIDNGGKLIYLDKRVGQNNKIFNLIKFRSMVDEQDGQKKISRVGNFLRKTRIDELPQLWNVLRGDMSLIGPRPEKIELTEVYNSQIPFYNIRNIVKPGLSGWAQLKQENHPHHLADLPATTEKLSYDLYYIKNRSFFLDLKIALQTFRIILSRKGR